MIGNFIVFDDVFDSLATIGNLSKPLIFSRANTIFPSLAAGLKYTVGYSRALSTVYGWNERALGKDLIGF